MSDPPVLEIQTDHWRLMTDDWEPINTALPQLPLYLFSVISHQQSVVSWSRNPTQATDHWRLMTDDWEPINTALSSLPSYLLSVVSHQRSVVSWPRNPTQAVDADAK